jgi:hypothetical protein
VKQHGPLLEEVHAVGASPSLISARREIAALGTKPLYKLQFANFEVQLYHEGKSLWILIEWPNGGQVAICAANVAFSATSVRNLEADDASLRADLSTELGVYHVSVDIPNLKRPLIHWRTTRCRRGNLPVRSDSSKRPKTPRE